MASVFKSLGKFFTAATAKNASYFKLQNVIGNVFDLQRLLKAAPKVSADQTTKEINFNSIPLREITTAKIKSRFGVPSFVHDNNLKIENHEVYFYLDSIDKYKFLIQYHFINGQIFFVSNKISSSLIELPASDKQKILGKLTKKYLDKDFVNSNGWSIKIVDPNNSIIYTVDEVYFQLYYLAGNETTKELINRYVDNYKPEESPETFNDSLDSYI